METRVGSRLPYVFAAVIILVYFCRLTVSGIHAGFSHDDLLNLWRARQHPLSRHLLETVCFFLFPESPRPLGMLFYRGFLDAFGLNPLPFRLCIFAVLIANLYLAFVLVRRVTASATIAALATLLHCYHIGFTPLFRDTVASYEVFGFFFYTGALVYYIGIRQGGEYPGQRQRILLFVLFVAALTATESALTLPAMIGAYELFYHPPSSHTGSSLLAWARKECGMVWWGALADLLFIVFKVHGTGGTGFVFGSPSAVRAGTYLRNLHFQLAEVFLIRRGGPIGGWLAGVLLIILILAVLRWKTPRFRFALVYWLVGIVPVAFLVAPRAMYAAYIPLLGLAMLVAMLLVRVQDIIVAAIYRPQAGVSLPDIRRERIQVAALLLLALALGLLYRAKGAFIWDRNQGRQIQSVIRDLRTQVPTARPGSRFLFLTDPFEKIPNGNLASAFIAQLLYGDSNVKVDRMAAMEPKPDAEAMNRYDYVLTTTDAHVTLVARGGSPGSGGPSYESTPHWGIVFRILAGAGLALITSLALGLLAVSAFRLKLYAGEKAVLSFVIGAALLSNLIFLLAALGAARVGVFLAICALILVAYAFSGRGIERPPALISLPRVWKILFFCVLAVYSWYYVSTALAPEVSSDGIAYHLGLVAQYNRTHSLGWITNNLYADLAQGWEMLFLLAFSVGKHSAAALVHCACLYLLALAMLRYGQHYGMPVAGACAALLVFVAPVIGFTGAIAYNDVAGALVAFAVFYFLRMWEDGDDARLLALAGLCAGFAYAIKFSSGVALAYGLIVIGARRTLPFQTRIRYACLFVASAAFCMAPWLLRNWIVVGNPVAPFFNRVFPNPYVTVDFEEILQAGLRHWNGLTLADLPLELTIGGQRATGFFGWVFLLSPLALLALTKREGRRLLLPALLFALPIVTNKGARFLIPAIPFLALAMAMVLTRLPSLAALIVVAHAVTCWPTVIERFCAPNAWHLMEAPWEAALRVAPEEAYITEHVPEYPVTRMLDARVPPGRRVYSLDRYPASYCSADVMVEWWGAENLRLRDALYLPLTSDYLWELKFRLSPQKLEGIRLVQTATGTDIWKISELKVLHAGQEIRRDHWKLNAHPAPWNMQMAIDGRQASWWRPNQALFPGMFFEAGFGDLPVLVDTVIVDCPRNQWQMRLRLEGKADGRWKELSESSERSDLPPPPDLRHQATAELKHSGISYLLTTPGKPIDPEIERDPAEWGLIPVDRFQNWRLYLIQ
ncbi:MAG: hypothetical protein U0Q18_23655 [Bryobacteraceae bacterium]